MLGLLGLLFGWLWQPKIIQIRRVPATKVLQANLLGLALAFLVVLTQLSIALISPTVLLNYCILIGCLAIFLVGTWIGGTFALITLVSLFIPVQSTSIGADWWSSLVLLSRTYGVSYLAAAFFATVYNDLLFIYYITFGKSQIKIAFAVDTTKPVNVIKSPISSEEVAFNELIQEKPELAELKLYKYQLDAPPKAPYTIAFVANPKILKRKVNPTDQPQYELDPIIEDRDLFLRSVDRALASFESNEVTGLSEIWSRVRVLILFQPSLQYQQDESSVALAQEFQGEIVIDGANIDNMLDTTISMPQKLGVILQNCQSPISIEEIDLIYVMSASPSHTRSSSRCADYMIDGETPICNKPGGVPFTFNPDPLNNKNSNGQTEIDTTTWPVPDNLQHDFYSQYLGRVALNVLGARNKSFVHEFGHAMSSIFNGAIVDEYADLFVIKGAAQIDPNAVKAPFYVNRIERMKLPDGKFVPVHKAFAQYNGTVFNSDLDHPPARENWLGYFPERQDPFVSCTMDSSGDLYRFDELLQNFMYGRLTAKLNRPK